MMNRKPSKCLKLKTTQLNIHFMSSKADSIYLLHKSAIATLFHLHHVSHCAAYPPDLFSSNSEWKK